MFLFKRTELKDPCEKLKRYMFYDDGRAFIVLRYGF